MHSPLTRTVAEPLLDGIDDAVAQLVALSRLLRVASEPVHGVGETVEVLLDLGPNLERLAQLDDPALGTADHRARKLQRRGGSVDPWDHEGMLGADFGNALVGDPLEILDVGLCDHGEVNLGAYGVRTLDADELGKTTLVSRELGAHGEQAGLDVVEHIGNECVASLGACDAQGRDGLVDSTVCIDARVGLAYAGSAHEGRGALVTGAGVDVWHASPPPPCRRCR